MLGLEGSRRSLAIDGQAIQSRGTYNRKLGYSSKRVRVRLRVISRDRTG